MSSQMAERHAPRIRKVSSTSLEPSVESAFQYDEINAMGKYGFMLAQRRMKCMEITVNITYNDISTMLKVFPRVKSPFDIRPFLRSLESFLDSNSDDLWPVIHDLKYPPDRYKLDFHVHGICLMKLYELFSPEFRNTYFHDQDFKNISDFKTYVKSLIVLDTDSFIKSFGLPVFHVRSPMESISDFITIVSAEIQSQTGINTAEAPPSFIPMIFQGLRENYGKLFYAMLEGYTIGITDHKFYSVDPFLEWLVDAEKSLPLSVRSPTRKDRDNSVMPALLGEQNTETPYQSSPKETQVFLPSNLSQYPAGKDPKTIAGVMERPDAIEWLDARDQELQTIKESGVYTLVNLPSGSKPLGSKYIFKTNFTNGDTKKTVRLVVRGSQQPSGKEYSEAHSEVASVDVVLTSLAIAVQHDWDIFQLDIKSGALYTKISDDIYVKQPEGAEDGTNRVWKLNKALDGLGKAQYGWFRVMKAKLEEIGFHHVSETPGLYFRVFNGIKTLLVLYVGKILIMSGSSAEAVRIKARINESFEMEGPKIPESFMSLRLHQVEGSLTIDLSDNVKKLLAVFAELLPALKSCKNISCLHTAELEQCIEIEKSEAKGKLVEDLKKPAALLNKHFRVQYASAVGCLNELVAKARPDIAFVTFHLIRHTSKPRVIHWRMLIRVLCYIRNNPEAHLNFSKSERLTLEGWAAASFPGSHVRHPHGGYFWKLGGCLIYWESKRLKLRCQSIEESEVGNMVNALNYGYSVRDTLLQIGEWDMVAETILYNDSEWALRVMKKQRAPIPTQQMRVNLDVIKNLSYDYKLQVQHCSSDANLAHLLTKPLPAEDARDKSGHLISFHSPFQSSNLTS